MSRPFGFKHTNITKNKIGEANRTENNGMWRGNLAKSKSAGRSRAQNKYVLSVCVLCNKKSGTDRHHIDNNTLNNKEENIMILCRGCHMEIDGRMNNFKKLSKKMIFSHGPDGRFISLIGFQ